MNVNYDSFLYPLQFLHWFIFLVPNRRILLGEAQTQASFNGRHLSQSEHLTRPMFTRL